MTKTGIIRIGTRGSKLALEQAYLVERLLKQAYSGLQTEIITIKTTGDKILEKNLSEIGGKGLFIKEIEEQLLDGSIDLAVHSMKDMPAFLHEAFEIPCILEREDPRDAFISPISSNIVDLPQDAVVGTSSPRRAAQALNLRSDLKIVPFRGNIHTRLEKIKKNEVDATFLAVAGINRSKITDKMITPIDIEQMIPAVAQGAIGIEICKNSDVKELLLPLHHEPTAVCVEIERAFLAALDGSCTTPIGCLAVLDGDEVEVDYMVASLDGSDIFRTKRRGKVEDGVEMSRQVALEKQETGS